jgi:hypothetical protein
MRFAKWTYRAAAIYGALLLAPLLFAEGELARTVGPLTRPEDYYGFLMAGLAFQAVFFVISLDPVRYRPLMPLTLFEKIPWGVTVWVLHLQGRTHGAVTIFASIDIALGLLFFVAWRRTPKA